MRMALTMLINKRATGNAGLSVFFYASVLIGVGYNSDIFQATVGEVFRISCCTWYSAAEAQFNRKVADRDLRRYCRCGADGTTRLLLTELRRWPLQGTSILDIGGGIGVIEMELADSGAGSGTVVEASPAYSRWPAVKLNRRC
jgi:hypothetical protein